ncbi:hypothetical protein ACO0LL_14020 [Undibacterium sp. TC4M20W]|uniref:hypothetical protein n=1 Tax=Undibacterium sp. TC4M20W TaxID=3413052 RepID=UPI003BF39D67
MTVKVKHSINIAELRSIINSILSHVEDDLQLKEVELTEDYYWAMPDDSLHAILEDAKEPNIGSLCEDLEFSKHILNDKTHAFPLMLTHVAPLLQYLALNIKKV